MQCNVKNNGESWALEQVPLMDKPTMIVGMDLSTDNVYSLVGTVNNRLT